MYTHFIECWKSTKGFKVHNDPVKPFEILIPSLDETKKSETLYTVAIFKIKAKQTVIIAEYDKEADTIIISKG